jgi:hypothetical protein
VLVYRSHGAGRIYIDIEKDEAKMAVLVDFVGGLGLIGHCELAGRPGFQPGNSLPPGNLAIILCTGIRFSGTYVHQVGSIIQWQTIDKKLKRRTAMQGNNLIELMQKVRVRSPTEEVDP